MKIKIMKNIKSEYIVKLIDNFYDEIYVFNYYYLLFKF